MIITILQGLPGSGKSTIAKTEDAVVVSADHYPGLYTHTPEGVRIELRLLGPAHGACFRAAIAALEARRDVVVDNTNLTVEECAPYFLLAQAFSVAPRLVTVLCDPEVAFARQQHGVPRPAFDQMVARLASFTPAGHWPFIPGFRHVVKVA